MTKMAFLESSLNFLEHNNKFYIYAVTSIIIIIIIIIIVCYYIKTDIIVQ